MAHSIDRSAFSAAPVCSLDQCVRWQIQKLQITLNFSLEIMQYMFTHAFLIIDQILCLQFFFVSVSSLKCSA